MSLSEALDKAGGFGLYQITHFIFLMLATNVPCGWHELLIVFQGKFDLKISFSYEALTP